MVSFRKKGEKIRSYQLFHDESKISGYWHGIYLVPKDTKSKLIKYINQIRNNTNYHSKIGLKKVKKKKSKIYGCAEGLVDLGVASLVQDFKGSNIQVNLGLRKKGQPVYEYFKDKIGAKFVLFHVKDNHESMKYYSDYASKIETTFRMGYQGGCHLLGDNDDNIEITDMLFDGYEHHRKSGWDKNRVVDRLENIRSYLKINSKCNIHDNHTNLKKKGSHNKENCQILYLTDLLVGGFRTILGKSTRDIQKHLYYPIKRLVNKYKKGPARMKNSKWNKGFCYSSCWLKDNNWKYDQFEDLVEKQKLSFEF